LLAAIPLCDALQSLGMLTNLGLPFSAQVRTLINVAKVTNLNLELLRLECSAPSRTAAYTQTYVLFALPGLLTIYIMAIYASLRMLGNSGRFKRIALLSSRAVQRKSCLDVLLGLMQLSHIAIVQAAFALFWCDELPNGSMKLRNAPHLDCKSDESYIPRIVACASLILWGVGIPIFLAVVVKKTYHNPEYSLSLVSYGYRPSHCYWDAWMCLRRFTMLLVITVFHPELAGFFLLIFMLLTTVVLVRCDPFANTLANRAQLGTDVLQFVIVLFGLFSASLPENLKDVSIFALVSSCGTLALLGGVAIVEVASMLPDNAVVAAIRKLWTSNESAVESVSTAAEPAKRIVRRISVAIFDAPSAFAFNAIAPSQPELTQCEEAEPNYAQITREVET
jgi:hypothetical protein